MSESNLPNVDFDTHWKEVITDLFEDFVAFFLPNLYPLIDFSVAPVFLEQELHKIAASNEKKGKTINDKLAKVYLKDGQEKWILIHIEVQAASNAQFPRRMFTYFYRILDRYQQDVTAIVVHIGEFVPKSYGRFEYNFAGTKAVYEYNYYITASAKEEDLLQVSNPFALIILAMQYTHKTKENGLKRFAFKRKLAELALEREYNRHQIAKLFKFVWYVLVLPKDLEYKLETEIIKITSMDEMHIEKSNEWANVLYRIMCGRTMDDFIAELRQEETKLKAQVITQTKLLKEATKLHEEETRLREEETRLREAAAKSSMNQIKLMLKLDKLSLEEIAMITNKTVEEIKTIAIAMKKE